MELQVLYVDDGTRAFSLQRKDVSFDGRMLRLCHYVMPFSDFMSVDKLQFDGGSILTVTKELREWVIEALR
jgi:hypothetical protein